MAQEYKSLNKGEKLQYCLYYSRFLIALTISMGLPSLYSALLNGPHSC